MRRRASKSSSYRESGGLRQRFLSNRIFTDYDDIVAAICTAWNKLTADPGRVKSIGRLDWASTGAEAKGGWYKSAI